MLQISSLRPIAGGKTAGYYLTENCATTLFHAHGAQERGCLKNQKHPPSVFFPGLSFKIRFPGKSIWLVPFLLLVVKFRNPECSYFRYNGASQRTFNIYSYLC